MASAQKILDYIKELQDEEKLGYTPKVHFNDSILHACAVMAAILRKAAAEPENTLNMFCGNFSLFRDETRQKVAAEKSGYDGSDLSDEDKKKWESLDLFTDLLEQMRKFLGKGKFNLIVQRDAEGLRSNTIWTSLQGAISDGRAKIYQMNEDTELDHFATTFEAYRIENSDRKKTAICCFKDPKNSLVLNGNFGLLTRRATPVFTT